MPHGRGCTHPTRLKVISAYASNSISDIECSFLFNSESLMKFSFSLVLSSFFFNGRSLGLEQLGRFVTLVEQFYAIRCLLSLQRGLV